MQLALEYSIDIQSRIPVALAAIYNFIHDQQPEEDGQDGDEDEDEDVQPIGGGVDVDDDEAEQHEGLDEDNERRDQIAGETWAQYLAEHVHCGVPLPEVDM